MVHNHLYTLKIKVLKEYGTDRWKVGGYFFFEVMLEFYLIHKN